MERIYHLNYNTEFDSPAVKPNVDATFFKPVTSDPRTELGITSLQNLQRAYRTQKWEVVPGGTFSHFGLLGNLQILGISPPEYLEEDIKKGFDLTDNAVRRSYFSGNEVFFGNLLSDMAGAKLIGMDINVSDEDRKFIQEQLAKRASAEWYASDFSKTSSHYRNDVVNAAIIGYDIPLDVENKRKIENRLMSMQYQEIYEYDRFINGETDLDGNKFEEGFNFNNWYEQYNLNLSHSLAGARILGIDVPLFQFTMDIIKKSLKANKQLPYYESAAANYAINAATVIRVGGDKGLELEF